MKEIAITVPELWAKHLPTVLTVAGSDSSGGAGIEADLKTITAHGCYGLTCITALTAQNTQCVRLVTPTDRQTLKDILAANFEDVDIDVVKTGMLTRDAIDELSEALEKWHQGKVLVVDPVMVATTGVRLSEEALLKRSVERLFKKATLITPNLPEAEELLHLCGKEVKLDSVDKIIAAAKVIKEKSGALNVLIKGGHAAHKNGQRTYLTDVLYTSSDDSYTLFQSEFIETTNTHGTGCTLASAVSSNLASGLSLVASVEAGIRYVHCGIVTARKIGHGNGPLNHVHHIDPPSFTLLESTPFEEGHFVEYLINHPTVAPLWSQYVHHPFVAAVADGSLSKEKFIHFVSQDYPYLVNYARVHSIAASVAPDLACLEREIVILTEIKHELGEHTKRLRDHGVEDPETLMMSSSCQEYADYLMDVARGGDWLEINVALAPCLLGYNGACAAVTPSDGISTQYKDWLDAYTSDWYVTAVSKGTKTLEKHSVGISNEKALKLVKIFADVCQLEVKFWDASLRYQS